MRIGTRGSALAVAQAEWVADRLQRAGQTTEVVTITTLGDRGAAVEDKSRWVSELERALLDGRIDVAVHSAKDVPAELEEGLELVAVPERADPRDAICGAGGVAELPKGARVGTSSVRRAAQILALRDDVDVVEVRGNVDTRLRKLGEGQVDALVLALAGLQRLGRDGEAGGVLSVAQAVPAAGQGALALEARPGTLHADVLHQVSDAAATACVGAERALVHALGASCNTPVGAHARLLGSGELELTGWVGLPDGSAWLHDTVRAPPQTAGPQCAERMLAAGAAGLLRAAEQVLGP
jgi:hydroxymethylbilane synthase